MGRTRSFDKQEAIEQALRLFWQVGYERASLEDLLKCMGIKNSSFYQAFGSKEKLFLEVVQYYRQNIGSLRLAILADDNLSTRECLTQYFHHLIHKPSRRGYPMGCFMTLTAASLTEGKTPVAESVAQSMKNLQLAFEGVLRRGRAKGEVSKAVDFEKTSLMCVSTAYGITVMGRAQRSKKELFETAEALIDLLVSF